MPTQVSETMLCTLNIDPKTHEQLGSHNILTLEELLTKIERQVVWALADYSDYDAGTASRDQTINEALDRFEALRKFIEERGLSFSGGRYTRNQLWQMF